MHNSALNSQLAIEIKGQEGAVVMKNYMANVFDESTGGGGDLPSFEKLNKSHRMLSSPLHFDSSENRTDIEISMVADEISP